MENRRKTERFSCLVPVDGQSNGLFCNTNTVDISRNGVGLISSHKIPLNQQIALELQLDENGEPVLVIGKVKWVKKIGTTGNYRIGLHFENIVDGPVSRLDKYFEKR